MPTRRLGYRGITPRPTTAEARRLKRRPHHTRRLDVESSLAPEFCRHASTGLTPVAPNSQDHLRSARFSPLRTLAQATRSFDTYFCGRLGIGVASIPFAFTITADYYQSHYLKKPNASYFENLKKVAAEHEISSDKLLFIDDKLENVIAANQLNIESIQYKNYEELAQQLLHNGTRMLCLMESRSRLITLSVILETMIPLAVCLFALVLSLLILMQIKFLTMLLMN